MTDGVPNLWNALYIDRVPPEQTKRECDFIVYFMPLDGFPRLLDLACETGRHTLEMASRGYHVTGADINTKALHVAAERAAARDIDATFVAADLRELDHVDGEFDGIILFWQSFGFFDSNVQVGMFTQLHRLLRPGGRLVLDLFNALYYAHEDTTFSHAGGTSGSRIGSLEADERLFGAAGYEDDLRFESRRSADLFDPHLFTPGEITGIAANHGFQLIAACSQYSPQVAPTREQREMQLVFEGVLSVEG